MSNFIASPLSRNKIRSLTYELKRIFNLEKEIYFPIVEFLEAMPDLFRANEFTFEIVPNNSLPPSVQGETDVINHYMKIKECVYDGAHAGVGRDRFSIAHEIGHYILMPIAGVQFRRNLTNRLIKAYEDPEWQAECFAGELLVPYHLVKGKTINEIAEQCKVSLPAARFQSKLMCK